MFGSFNNKALRLFVVFALTIGSMGVSAFAQSSPKPLLQPIIIQTGPSPSPTPLVKKTGSSTPVMDNVSPGSAGITIPGYSGVLVETLDGKVVKDSYSNYAFNPASNVKIATSYAVLKSFGPDYRFPTNVFTDGTIDTATGTLNGNLYVSGRDPSFTLENGVEIALALNKLGVRSVNGDLIVTSSFIMALNPSVQRSADVLYTTLDSSRRSAAASRAWSDFVISSGKTNMGLPSVSIAGGTYVDVIPTNARLLFIHDSPPLREIVKVMNCFSNNFMAEKLGDMIGGAYAVSKLVQVNAGVTSGEFFLQTSSGLGINRVTPRAMMRMLRTLRSELAKYRMTFSDIMPVAGVDPGTLQNRFKYAPGSVVGKTGTLGQTDGGASSLAGEMQTRNGKLLFVIFNQRAGTSRSRNFQETFVSLIQSENGGPGSLGYGMTTLERRMANTKITYPTTKVALN